jgi:hypothetical protein
VKPDTPLKKVFDAAEVGPSFLHFLHFLLMMRVEIFWGRHWCARLSLLVLSARVLIF